MSTKAEKESMPATEVFTFKIRGIVKAVIPLEYVGYNNKEKRGLVISQKGDDKGERHPATVVNYRGDKGVAIDNCGGIQEGDEVETTFTPTMYSYQRDGKTIYGQNNTGRSIKIITKNGGLFAQQAAEEDDLPF